MTAPLASPRKSTARRFQLAVVASVVAAAFGLALLTSGNSSTKLMIQGTGNGPIDPGPSGTGVRNGDIASAGHFTATGAIKEEGTYTDRRSVKGQIATARRVLDGRKGTITIVITIHLGRNIPARWTITSGTGSYAGVHGKGVVTVDNYQDTPYTFVMTGTVSP